MGFAGWSSQRLGKPLWFADDIVKGRGYREGPVSDVRIFQPARSAMQSGRGKTHRWMLEFEREARQVADPLMGWIGSSDTRPQLRLLFDTREEAVAFAERNNLSYDIQEPRAHKVRPKSYADNFRYDGSR